MTQTKRIILGIAAAASILLIIGAIIMGLGAKRDQAYTTNIKTADRYYSEGDYENAVLAYQEVIKLNDREPEPYIGLANSYQALGDNKRAIDTLSAGYEKTRNIRIKLLIADFEKSGDTVVNNVVNRNMLTTFETRTFGEMKKENGVESTEVTDEGVSVRVKDIDAEFVYKNTDLQPEAVKNNTVDEDSRPVIIHLDNISDLFNGVETVTYDELTAMEFETMQRDHLKEHGEIVSFMIDNCLVTVECDEEGTIHNGAWNTIELMSSGVIEEEDKFTIKGNVVDASTGSALSGVSITFRKDGSEEGTAVSDASGNYAGNVTEPGLYEATAEKEGYTTLSQEVYVSQDQTGYMDFVLSQELAAGEARVVLEWGADPDDLDLYCSGETDNGEGVFVYFSEKSALNNNGITIADLDVDDTSSYGPETVTLYDLNGTYHFFVNNFSARKMISGSEAKLTVYLPGHSPRVLTLDDGAISEDDEIWDVFTLDHGEIRISDSVNINGSRF